MKSNNTKSPAHQQSRPISQNRFMTWFCCRTSDTSSVSAPDDLPVPNRLRPYFDFPVGQGHETKSLTMQDHLFNWLGGEQPTYRDERLSIICHTLLDEIERSVRLSKSQAISSVTVELHKLLDDVQNDYNPSLTLLFMAVQKLHQSLNTIEDTDIQERVGAFIVRIASLFYEGNLNCFESSKITVDNCQRYLNELMEKSEHEDYLFEYSKDEDTSLSGSDTLSSPDSSDSEGTSALRY